MFFGLDVLRGLAARCLVIPPVLLALSIFFSPSTFFAVWSFFRQSVPVSSFRLLFPSSLRAAKCNPENKPLPVDPRGLHCSNFSDLDLDVDGPSSPRWDYDFSKKVPNLFPFPLWLTVNTSPSWNVSCTMCVATLSFSGLALAFLFPRRPSQGM